MLRHRVLIATALIVGLQATTAFAQDRPEAYAAALKRSCAAELKSRCTGVQEGRGRLLACLYAYENKLSARCGEVVFDSMERLGEAIGSLANVRRVCEGDVRRLCNGVAAGNGNLVGCLSQTRRNVSSQCNAALDGAFLRP
jgi:hypothetical protein